MKRAKSDLMNSSESNSFWKKSQNFHTKTFSFHHSRKSLSLEYFFIIHNLGKREFGTVEVEK